LTVAAQPLKLPPGEWVAGTRRAAGRFLADDCMGLAQQIAYSWMLAFFPAVAFFLGLLGVLNLYDQLKSFVDPISPPGVTSFIDGLQKDSQGGASVTALVLGGAAAVWIASGAMGTVIKAVNRAYDRMETRPFWRTRLTAIALVLLSSATILLLAVLIVFGGPIGHAIADKAGLGSVFTLLWGIARWPIAFVAVLLLFALVYYYSPNVEHRRWQWVTPGSVVGALLWLALSGLFTLYVTFAGSYSRTYGALAAGVILMLWLNYSAWSILFGAELNSALEQQADIRAAGGEHAGLTRPSRRLA
jgi:membrane protein